MRESSYLTTHRYHDFRNMTPDNYKPAIGYLLNQGIHVVRLGDAKSTALAMAIGYADLFWAIGGAIESQTGQVLELQAITLGLYLSLSLFIALIMNWYNYATRIPER